MGSYRVLCGYNGLYRVQGNDGPIIEESDGQEYGT